MIPNRIGSRSGNRKRENKLIFAVSASSLGVNRIPNNEERLQRGLISIKQDTIDKIVHDYSLEEPMHNTIVKKTVIILLAIAITGCSAIPPLDLSFLTPNTPLPTDTPEPTVTLFPSPTPTRDLFMVNTEAPTSIPPTLEPGVLPTRTSTPTRMPRPTITMETLDPKLYTPSPNIFNFVQKSTNQIVWGYNCDGDRSIMFTVTVTPVRRMKYVLLFVRLQDKYSGRGTDWGAGAIMKDNDQGIYFYRLELDQIVDYKKFEDAWLQYQFVASTIGLTVLGRSVVDRTSVSITDCRVLDP